MEILLNAGGVWTERDGATVHTTELGYPDRTFTVVDSIPTGYMIWPIGRHAPEGYVPLARPIGKHGVDTDSLIAVECSRAEEINALSIFGGGNPITWRNRVNGTGGRFISRHRDELARVLPLVESLPWQ